MRIVVRELAGVTNIFSELYVLDYLRRKEPQPLTVYVFAINQKLFMLCKCTT